MNMRERNAEAIMQANVNTLVQILETEHRGAENATTNAALAKRMGMEDRGSSGRQGLLNSTTLTKTIQRAREQGHPIATDHRGVFYARNQMEFAATVEMLEQRSSTYGQLAAAARRTAGKFFGFYGTPVPPGEVRPHAPVKEADGSTTFLRMRVPAASSAVGGSHEVAA